MRIKTASKKTQISDAARRLFLSLGYERTLMSRVAQEAGCSKGTLYSYFTSKEDLLCQVLFDQSDSSAGRVLASMQDSAASTLDKLHHFGVEFLRALYSPEFQEVRRLAFVAGSDPSLGPLIFAKVVQPYQEELAKLLDGAMATGELRLADARVAADHLCALLESELLIRFLMHTLSQPTDEFLRGAAQRAIAAFSAAYWARPRTSAQKPSL